MKRCIFVLAALAVLFTGCASAPTPSATKKKEPEPPPEPVTGLTAVYRIHPVARAWAIDAQPLRGQSILLNELKYSDGKYAAWRIYFVSATRGKMKGFTFSAVESEGNLHKDVFAGPEESYGGPTRQAKPILLAALRIDTPAAWETASKKSQDYLKKFPNTPVTFVLESSDRFPNPYWRVVWGESVGTSNYSIFVDATTGEYLQTGR